VPNAAPTPKSPLSGSRHSLLVTTVGLPGHRLERISYLGASELDRADVVVDVSFFLVTTRRKLCLSWPTPSRAE
jgi:hypothetical protein